MKSKRFLQGFPYALYLPIYILSALRMGKHFHVCVFIPILETLILQSLRISSPDSFNNVD